MISGENTLRLMIFLGLFGLLFAAERLWPRRPTDADMWRVLGNLALTGLGTVLLRLLSPLLAIALAFADQGSGIGLFQWLDVPLWLSVFGAVLLLDMGIYFQHRLFHWWHPMWQLHRVHHSDASFDLSLALRFHPLELFCSQLVKLGLVIALGAPPLAVLLFEVLLNAGALFSHSNLRLPASLDRVLRWVIVTPDMHRIHHSTDAVECQRNFSNFLSVWDRVFGTYQPAPKIDTTLMPLGIAQMPAAARTGLWALLRQPWSTR